ncbi:MAG: MarR family winged helix-turn-helix transcriptional regulator [Spirochaetaceae bacterium]
MNIYKLAEELLLGSRLKKIGEKIFSDISKVYKDRGIDFEPSWFPVFFLLNEKTLTISDIANYLEVTQSAVSQMISVLEKRELVIIKKDDIDKRSKTISLSIKGKKLLVDIKPIWTSIKKSLNKLLKEGENSKNLLISLNEVETSIYNNGIQNRIENDIKHSILQEKLNINVYQKSNEKDLKSMLLEWMTRNNKIISPEVINNPDKFISNNGNIYIVYIEGNIVGCMVSKLIGSSLSKIICIEILPKWKGFGIEKKIIKQLERDNKTDIDIILDIRESDQITICKEMGFELDLIVPEENETSRCVHLIKR